MPTPTTPKPIDFMEGFLTISAVVAFFAILALLAWDKIPPANVQLFTMVVSFVSGTWLGAILHSRFTTPEASKDSPPVNITNVSTPKEPGA